MACSPWWDLYYHIFTAAVSQLCEPSLPLVPTPWHAAGAHTPVLSPIPSSPLPQAIYKKVDSDYSGTIDSHEMRNALREAGECAAQGLDHQTLGEQQGVLMAFLLSCHLDHSIGSDILPSWQSHTAIFLLFHTSNPIVCIKNHWYFCPCCGHCFSIWLLLALFLASLFPNLIVLFQSCAQTLFFLHFLPPPFSPLEKVQAWSRHAPMMSSLMC